jgi:hypothetical protein
MGSIHAAVRMLLQELSLMTDAKTGIDGMINAQPQHR